MKSIGIVRRIDNLGKIVIPKELRNSLKIHSKDPIEIFAEGETIVLKKYQAACIFCGKNENLTYYKNRPVCKGCIYILQNQHR